MPPRKSKPLTVLCPPDLHAAFMDVAMRSGESAGVILRRFVSDTVERARKGERVTLRIAPEGRG